jgi:hypothetical protein
MIFYIPLLSSFFASLTFLILIAYKFNEISKLALSIFIISQLIMIIGYALK